MWFCKNIFSECPFFGQWGLRSIPLAVLHAPVETIKRSFANVAAIVPTIAAMDELPTVFAHLSHNFLKGGSLTMPHRDILSRCSYMIALRRLRLSQLLNNPMPHNIPLCPIRVAPTQNIRHRPSKPTQIIRHRPTTGQLRALLSLYDLG